MVETGTMAGMVKEVTMEGIGMGATGTVVEMEGISG
jgi:hypothetical protein